MLGRRQIMSIMYGVVGDEADFACVARKSAGRPDDMSREIGRRKHLSTSYCMSAGCPMLCTNVVLGSSCIVSDSDLGIQPVGNCVLEAIEGWACQML